MHPEFHLSLAQQAALWGGVSGGALLLGAFLGYFFSFSQRTISLVMAFGSGVLVSALAFDLVLESAEKGHLVATSLGFFIGAAFYTGANALLDRYTSTKTKAIDLDAKSAHKKPSETSSQNSDSSEEKGSGASIALGALLDGVPESAAIGVSLIGGQSVAFAAVIAIFISNIPEGLASAAEMKEKKSARFIFGMWASITIASALSALLGYSVLAELDSMYMAFTLSFAAGAILAMIMQTMIPQAYKVLHGLTGFVGALGFLLAFIVHQCL